MASGVQFVAGLREHGALDSCLW